MGRFIDITGAPIVSDFQEMPLDFMAKALSAKQAAYDKQDLEAAGVPGLIPEGFIATKGYKDILTKELNPKLADWSKRAIADPEGVGRDIAKYKSQLATDARYRLLAADTLKKADYLKQKAEAEKLGIPFEKAFDYKAGKYKGPIDPDKLLKGEVAGDLEDFYGTPIYGDVNKELLDRVNDIKTFTIDEAHDYFGSITKYGDQLKNNKVLKLDSNSIYDETPVLQTADGKWHTVAELTKLKLDKIGGTWLAGNTVGAQYGKTELSPIMQAPGKDFSEKLSNYLQYLQDPVSKYSKSTSTGFTNWGNIYDAENKKKESERVSIPGQNNYSTDANGFTQYVTDVYNTKVSSATSVVQKLMKSGALKGDMATIMKQVASNANPQQLQNILDNVNTKLDGLRKNIASGKGYDKDDFMYQTELKNDLTTLVDAMESEAKIKDRFLNTLSTTKDDLLKRIKHDGSTADNLMIEAVKDIETINKNATTQDNITRTLSKNKFITDAMSDAISNSVVPNYSVRTGLGNDTGIIKGVQDAITKSWSQNNSIFEGQSKDLTPNEWIKDQLKAADTDDVNVVDAAVDKNGKWIVTFKATNGGVKSFVYKDQGELDYHKGQLINDLRKTNDPNAQDFANSLMFKDVLTSNNQQAKWLSLASAQPVEGRPVTVNFKFSNLKDPLPVTKVMNPQTGNIYYTIGNKIATDLDDVAAKLGQFIK